MKRTYDGKVKSVSFILTERDYDAMLDIVIARDLDVSKYIRSLIRADMKKHLNSLSQQKRRDNIGATADDNPTSQVH